VLALLSDIGGPWAIHNGTKFRLERLELPNGDSHPCELGADRTLMAHIMACGCWTTGEPQMEALRSHENLLRESKRTLSVEVGTLGFTSSSFLPSLVS
jgi:hypothetical protein